MKNLGIRLKDGVKISSPFSRDEFIHIFAFCAIATHSWGIFNMFRHVASWSLSLGIWDLIGTVSYTLISILFETIVFFLFILIVGFLLPKKWIGDRYETLGLVLVLEITILAIVVKPFVIAESAGTAPWLFVVLILAMGLILILILRMRGISEVVRRIAVPLTTLAFVYIFWDLMGLLIVLIRNL